MYISQKNNLFSPERHLRSKYVSSEIRSQVIFLKS